jgi:hypothetical protein
VPPPPRPGPRGGREGTVPYKPGHSGPRRPPRLRCTGGEGVPGTSRAEGPATTTSLILCVPSAPFPFPFPTRWLPPSYRGLSPEGIGRDFPRRLRREPNLVTRAHSPPTQDAQGSGTRAAAGGPVPGDSGVVHRSLEDQEAGSANRAAPVSGDCQSKQA